MQQLASKFDCFGSKSEQHKKLVMSMNPLLVDSVANFVAERFNDPLLNTNGIKWLLLGNYVESIIR